ncbi:MAG: hypothetical protein Ct9H90mP5_05010 [Acidimicrobiaceae bacterium]|nr:MAG: hypothetical protein Ct9H90mP5_05010 [Acidimicrobiaceae bacterium]
MVDKLLGGQITTATCTDESCHAGIGYDSDALTVQVTQLVKLLRAGEEVKLSKRQGDIIELRSIIEEIGADATRFMYLLQSVDSKQTFDLELAASQGMDNPVYYFQMAYARLCSIERKQMSMVSF